jgi:hypothetical protein
VKGHDLRELPEAQVRVTDHGPLSGVEEPTQRIVVVVGGEEVAWLPVTACSWEMSIGGTVSKLRLELMAGPTDTASRRPRNQRS